VIPILVEASRIKDFSREEEGVSFFGTTVMHSISAPKNMVAYSVTR